MEIEVIILLGCTTAEDLKGKEYNIEGAGNATAHEGVVETDGIRYTIQHGERHEATVIGEYTVKLKKRAA